MKSALGHVLRHNTWATGTLLDFCRTLDPARLDDHAAGTYGTLYGTLQHLVGAEQLDEGKGPRTTVGVILAQLVHHGNEHHTQVTTILGSNGTLPPPVSAWGYGRAARISETGE